MTRFVLKAEPPVRLALDGLIPERIGSLSLAEIERLPLAVGNRHERVGDWFRVERRDAGAIEIEGDGHRLDRIGAGMSAGSIVVRGSAGAYLGLSMRGGSVLVAGVAGYGAATDLRGGSLRVEGDAGDALGGSLPGAGSGMRGGLVVVTGSAGAQAGQRLRRGLIVVLGAAGDVCGAGMVAGTIVVGRHVGRRPGIAMRRGSIVALEGAGRLSPTFGDCGVHELPWLRVLARHLVELGLETVARRLGPLRRWAGDAAVGGRGELLLAP